LALSCQKYKNNLDGIQRSTKKEEIRVTHGKETKQKLIMENYM